MIALLLALYGPPAADLGCEDYYRREAAEARLKGLGPLAWPALFDAADSDDPEVRLRADRLLRPWRSLCAELRAAAVLTGAVELNPAAFFQDDQLRLRVHRMAVAAGAGTWPVWSLSPDSSYWCQPWGVPAWAACQAALEECRGYCRGVAPMPRTPAAAAFDVPDVLPP